MKKLKFISSRVALLLLLVVLSASVFCGYALVSAPTAQSDAEAARYLPDEAISVSSVPSSASNKSLIPGGITFGVKFHTKGVMVIGFEDVECAEGRKNPAYEVGIRANDIITAVNGKALTSASELSKMVDDSNGAQITVTYNRNGKEYNAKLTPKYSKSEGKYKTGLWVRDSGAGIGTVTYIDPDDLTFGGLGHGICDTETGSLIPMDKGSVLGVTIGGIKKGTVGAPGEIKGYFSTGKKGTLYSNTLCGVFGAFSECPQGLISESLSVGSRNDLKEGDAQIICTLDETGAHKYNVKISEINRSANGNKCFSVTVTDKALIEKTGGIVQGMSGSPIIQNGKLVGAVTHVLINDPTRGYGIFIENMLDASNIPMAKVS